MREAAIFTVRAETSTSKSAIASNYPYTVCILLSHMKLYCLLPADDDDGMMATSQQSMMWSLGKVAQGRPGPHASTISASEGMLQVANILTLLWL